MYRLLAYVLIDYIIDTLYITIRALTFSTSLFVKY